MNIVTSICVDEVKADESYYPNAKYMNPEQRKLVYWKCVLVFCCSSIRCNPSMKHIVFTNDKNPVIINGIDCRKFLSEMGVEIVYLPFQHFNIPNEVSNNFKNAFYKLDVIKELGLERYGYSILLDSDCVWVKHNPELYKIIESDKLFIYDVYQRDSTKKIHGISRMDMGKAYKEADKDFPIPDPILFGGEIIGGSSYNFKLVSDHILHMFEYIIQTFGKNLPKLSEKETILDSDEHVASLVYNKLIHTSDLKWVDANGILKRIWTGLDSSGAKKADLDLTIWHLPKEKTQGLPLLINKVFNKNSSFWKVGLDTFNVYLGKYLGIPKRESKLEKSKFIILKLMSVFSFYISDYKNKLIKSKV
jgi:hypothetical protein